MCAKLQIIDHTVIDFLLFMTDADEIAVVLLQEWTPTFSYICKEINKITCFQNKTTNLVCP